MIHDTQKIHEKTITICQFHPSDQTAVRNLIIAGLEDHWGTLDDRFNHDLDDISSTYSGHTILVATIEDEIVGCGILIMEKENIGRIVRMSVARHKRRMGIGQMILWHLVREARQRGYEKIVLETTETWQDAVSFYERNGFNTSHFENGDRHFVLKLT